MNNANIHFFHKKQCSRGTLQQVMTAAYKINPRTGLVAVGSTLYKKDTKASSWDRKLHCSRARERLTEEPIVFKFGHGLLSDPSKEELKHYQHRRLEKFIHKYICENGMFNRDANKRGILKVDAQDYRDEIFTTVLTQREQDDYNNKFGEEEFCESNDSSEYYLPKDKVNDRPKFMFKFMILLAVYVLSLLDDTANLTIISNKESWIVTGVYLYVIYDLLQIQYRLIFNDVYYIY